MRNFIPSNISNREMCRDSIYLGILYLTIKFCYFFMKASYFLWGLKEEKWKCSQSSLTLCDPMDCSPQGYSPWNSLDKNTGVGSHSLLQGIFPTQVSYIAGRFFILWATREASEVMWGEMRGIVRFFTFVIVILFLL